MLVFSVLFFPLLLLVGLIWGSLFPSTSSLFYFVPFCSGLFCSNLYSILFPDVFAEALLFFSFLCISIKVSSFLIHPIFENSAPAQPQIFFLVFSFLFWPRLFDSVLFYSSLTYPNLLNLVLFLACWYIPFWSILLTLLCSALSDSSLYYSDLMHSNLVWAFLL